MLWFSKPDHTQEILLLKWKIEESFREGNFHLTKELIGTLSKNYGKELRKRLIPLQWNFTDNKGSIYTAEEAMEILNNVKEYSHVK
jgi:hypothetical protein